MEAKINTNDTRATYVVWFYEMLLGAIWPD